MLLILLKIFFGGIFCLYMGGETLVKVATNFAMNLRVSPVVIGLTFIAWSTSMPEGVSSLMAQFQGERGDIAIGNIFGSNIANLAFVLGLSVFVCPIKVVDRVKKRDMPIMLGATFFTTILLFVCQGFLNRYVSILIFLGFLFYLWFQLKHAEEIESADEEHLQTDLYGEFREGKQDYVSQGLNLSLAILLLVGGSYFLVDGAVELAQLFGMSDRVIGLTVVALGSSAPELATSLVAAFRGHGDDFTLGGIIGSNVFNLLFIIGVVGIIYPIHYSMTLVFWDATWMIAITLLFWYLVSKRERLGHKEGLLLLSSYGIYIFSLFFVR
ncbi:Putative antiporter CaxA [Chlamydiales bacterium SCGC AB-751-O23]|jgi:cation:H+ antiporter|nr:Putative antiporter CaxA [Chlamydiales bacterium SCGC AB-751-O23]